MRHVSTANGMPLGNSKQPTNHTTSTFTVMCTVNIFTNERLTVTGISMSQGGPLPPFFKKRKTNKNKNKWCDLNNLPTVIKYPGHADDDADGDGASTESIIDIDIPSPANLSKPQTESPNASRPSDLHNRRPKLGTTMSSPTPGQVPPAESKLYAIRATDRANGSALRAQTRPAHLEWVVRPDLCAQFGGPIRNETDGPVKGSLFIVRCDSEKGVREKFSADPYAMAGLFDGMEVRQWVCGMRSEAPLPLQLFMVRCVDRAGAIPAGLPRITKDVIKSSKVHYHFR